MATKAAKTNTGGTISASKVRMAFTLVCNNKNCGSGFRMREGQEVFNRCPYCGQSNGFTCQETGDNISNTTKENPVYLTVGE